MLWSFLKLEPLANWEYCHIPSCKPNRTHYLYGDRRSQASQTFSIVVTKGVH